MQQWISISGKESCEICGYTYQFEQVLDEQAPSRLPLHLLMVGVSLETTELMAFLTHLAFLLLVWLVLAPLIAFVALAFWVSDWKTGVDFVFPEGRD